MNRSQLRYTRSIGYALPTNDYKFGRQQTVKGVRVHYLSTDIERQAIGIYTPEDLLLIINGNVCPFNQTAVLYVDDKKNFDYEVTSITPHTLGFQITARKRVK